MPAGNTYEAIATQTLGSAAASVTFSSIPSTYTDLVLVVAGAGTVADNVAIQINGDTASNYSRTNLSGFGSGSGSSFRESNISTELNCAYFSTVQSVAIMNFLNYSNTTTNKTFLARSNASDVSVAANVCLYRSTSAINSIRLRTPSTTFVSGSTFSLYGIASA